MTIFLFSKYIKKDVKKVDPISEESIDELKLQNETMKKDMANISQKMNQVLEIMTEIKSHIGDEKDHSSYIES